MNSTPFTHDWGPQGGVFAAMSLDGYLAEANDGLDFLASVQREDEDYGYMAFGASSSRGGGLLRFRTHST